MPQPTSQKPTFKHRLHEIIFESETPAGAVFDIGLLIVIVLSIVVISLETVDGIGWIHKGEENIFEQSQAGHALSIAKWIFTGMFTIEYLLRIYCVNRPWKYIVSFWGIIDLLSFLPDYLMFLYGPGSHFAVIRSLRLLRAFRIFKLGWFHAEAVDLGGALWRSRAKVIVFLSVVMILVTVTGTLMYEVENAFQKEASQFKSIPDGIYWAIVTMTTVGFGDIVPITVPGKFLSAFLILAGYSLIIVPTGFVTAKMIQAGQRKLTTVSCPSCISEGHDRDAVYCKYCGEPL